MRSDPNLAFPLDRVREMVAERRIGALAERNLSFMGSITAPGRLLREVAEKVRPPRALVVPFRHGFPLGAPHDAGLQRRVIEAALALLDRDDVPLIAWPDSPSVVIVTMHEDAEYRRRAKEASADGFVCKSQFTSEVSALVDAFFKVPPAARGS